MLRLPLLAIFILLSCTQKQPAGQPTEAGLVAVEPHQFNAQADVFANLDETFHPCDDFWRYACGGYIKQVTNKGPLDQTKPIQATYVGDYIKEKNKDLLGQILGENWPLVSPFYRSCGQENMANIQSQGLSALQPTFDQIDQLQDIADLPEILARIHSMEVSILFSPGTSTPLEKPNKNKVANFDPPGFGLNTSVYLAPTQGSNPDVIKKYKVTLKNAIDRLKGDATQVDAIFNLESRLAKASGGKDQVFQVDLATLGNILPNFSFDRYFSEILGARKDTLATQPVFGAFSKSYFQALSEELTAENLALLKLYMKTQLLVSFANIVAIDLNTQATHSEQQFGLQAYQPRSSDDAFDADSDRDSLCVGMTDQLLWPLLDRYYVNYTFERNTTSIGVDLVANLKTALHARLEHSQWLKDSTEVATNKLDALVKNIPGDTEFPAYPDYEGVSITRKDFLANVLQIKAFRFREDMASTGTPADRHSLSTAQPLTSWNAYYQPSKNSITILAAEFQYPMFAASFPLPLIYGGIGRVVGHEITHGFDSKNGFRLDGEGFINFENGTENPNGWWAAATVSEYKKRQQCYVQQFAGYKLRNENFELVANAPINGTQTLGENIADIGGIKIAHDALEAEIGADQMNAPSPVGTLTNAQLFFIGYARSRCQAANAISLERQVKSDVHSPFEARVMVTLMQTPEFADAFGCKTGHAMVPAPANQCTLW